jgi:hypothetical protein
VLNGNQNKFLLSICPFITHIITVLTRMREGYILILWVDRCNHISPNISRISTSRITFQNEMGFTFGKIRYILRVFYSRTFLNVTHIFVQLYKLFTELIILYWYTYNEVQRAWYTWEWNIVNLATVLLKHNLEAGCERNLIQILRFCNWRINPFT